MKTEEDKKIKKNVEETKTDKIVKKSNKIFILWDLINHIIIHRHADFCWYSMLFTSATDYCFYRTKFVVNRKDGN